MAANKDNGIVRGLRGLDALSNPIKICLIIVCTVVLAPMIGYCGSLLSRGTTIDHGTSVDHRTRVVLMRAIRGHGYRCDTVDAATPLGPFDDHAGFNVYCNDWQYKYLIEDRGGNWTVTLD